MFNLTLAFSSDNITEHLVVKELLQKGLYAREQGAVNLILCITEDGRDMDAGRNKTFRRKDVK